jgi:RND family efflux transporter MFP subunit
MIRDTRIHLLSLLFFSTIVAPGCRERSEDEVAIRPVKAMQIPESDELEKRRFSGRATAAREVNLSFRVSGPLIAIPVSVGDTVEHDQMLARVDPTDFEQRVRTIRAQLDEAQARAALAEEELARFLDAQNRGVATDLEVLEKRANRDATAASVRAIEASLQTAIDELGYTSLHAPFGGRIVSTFVENFENVRAKQEVLRLLDDEVIEIVIDVPETLIGLARQGMEAYAEFDAVPGLVLDATIIEISTEASDVTRTYPVTLSMMQPTEGPRVMPGMTGRVWAKETAGVASNNPVVPLSAVLADGQQQQVWVVDPDTGEVAKRDIQIGEVGSRGVRIDGVARGEWIAIAGVHYLHEGQQVHIQTMGGSGASQ